MDINDLRIAVTVVSLVLFLLLMAHTFSRRRKAGFDEAAMLPFGDEAQAAQTPTNAPANAPANASPNAPANTPARASANAPGDTP